MSRPAISPTRHATLCLPLSMLCADPPEQRCEKSRKMPSCSGSESRDSRMWSVTTRSRLDEGLGPELVSAARAVEEVEEWDASEPWGSSPGDGSGRMLGE